MKKFICVFLMLLFVSGCFEEQRRAERAALVQRFQAAYPDNWEQKLLEYDIEQDRQQQLQQNQSNVFNDVYQQSLQRQQQEETYYKAKPDGQGGYIIRQYPR
jgi:hypothetical protein